MARTKEENSMSAVIETGGKQYRVNNGQTITVEKLEAEIGSTITFDRVLMVSENDTVHLGSPLLTSHTVTGEVVEQGKGDKIRVFTFKSKKRQKRTLGHRQPQTKVKIVSIAAAKTASAKTPAKSTAAK